MASSERWESRELVMWEFNGFIQGCGTQAESKISFFCL